MDYKKYFDQLSNELINLSDTKNITNTIKKFTKTFFENDVNKIVYYSKHPNEFLYDVSVLNFNPKDIIKSGVNGGNKEICINDSYKEYSAFLLLESELGGESGSSAYGVFRNVLEDFSKLLIGNSKHKVMIMALSPYSNEANYIENRLEILKKIYINSNCNSNMLLIIIEGHHNNGRNQVKLNTKNMFGYILSAEEIEEV